MELRSSTWTVSFTRFRFSSIARPTATSAAAMPIENSANIYPDGSLLYAANATKLIFAASA